MQRSFASITLFVGGASSQETKLLHTWECYTAVFSVKFDSKCHYPVLKVSVIPDSQLYVFTVRFNALVCLPIEEDPWGDTLMNVHTTPLPLHLLWPWPFAKINCHVPITSVLCEPLFDYTWESSKTLHKVPSMLAACKSRTNKCSNFARRRQSGREHVDMFSNSVRCMDCMTAWIIS